ncbi:MAG: (2Fe-2S)-binding protein [Acidimicrobiales bacterium]|mgnify:FL=1|jgi:carbon-monoxide dehydrogenase small subunit|nr:(2Fe-2S)-binding protein [Acidimicrobiales bacterium]MDP6902372.1 (2Fe-2S)-binding protein [Acidimicrobiales bacterium]HJL99189.1 (2Fe-2S)-binding protein [Acidimicrobiales bacterium]
MARTHITTVVNGDETEFLTEDGTSLLNALRDEVGLTGVKEGCGTGDCGACSVMIDDKVTCACLVFAPEVDGSTILTVEGLADSGELHPLQQCFLEGAALQCGICTPGFLISAKALLDKNPDPTETEIRYALAGNLCRCTGYDKIIRAVQEAAREMRGQ